MSQPTIYCLGFLFTDERDAVVLIEKQRPDWQRGKWNGIGGHVEEGERPEQAMRREANEEIGARMSLAWEPFAIMDAPAWICYCYRAFDTQAAEEASGDADGGEAVAYCPLAGLATRPLLANLQWLIPLALDSGAKNNPAERLQTSLINYGGCRDLWDLIAADSVPASEYFADLRSRLSHEGTNP